MANMNGEPELEKDNTEAEDKKTISDGADTEDTAKASDNIEDNIKENADAEDNGGESEEKPLLPRKRRILKNNQLLITACLTCAAVLALIVWGVFFDQSVIGTWHYTLEAEASTADTPEDTSDEADITRVIEYEFRKDGTCDVTLGTMTVSGSYQLASDEDMGNLLSAAVYYGYSPVFYGTYTYKVTGNVFTGKKLILENAYYAEEPQTLVKGAAKELLTPFENKKIDDRLTGKWYDSENDITYEFTSDGEMIRSTSNGLSVRHLYTIMQDNIILAKYYSEGEESYTYGYEFQDDHLYIDGFIMTKLDR